MSTIRYTLGGDYDSANSRKLNTDSVGSPLTGIRQHVDENFIPDGRFIIYGPLGEEVVRKLDVKHDGIYADFSDAFGATIGGSDVGDVLIGSPGADTIYAGRGDDRIIGGQGGDSINTGLDDADIIVYLSPKDSPKNDPDKITNFSHIDRDKIDVSAMGEFTFIGYDAFNANGTAEIRIQARGVVFGDVNGDGRPDFKLRVSRALEASDFIGVHPESETPAHTSTFLGAHPVTHLAFAEPLHGLAHLALA